MGIVSDSLAFGAAAVQNTSSFAARAADDTKAQSDVVKVAIAILECANICFQEAVLKPLFVTLKSLNEFFSAVNWTGRSYNLLSGKAFWDNPIQVHGENMPNPLTFASLSCLVVGDAAATVKFASSMDWIDLGKFAETVGSVPFFGSSLKYGVENISLVRATFGMLGAILDAVDSVRGMIMNGFSRFEMVRISIDILKIAHCILFECYAQWLKFLAHVCNGLASVVSLVNFATR